MKRSPLRPISRKRQDRRLSRAVCVVAVVARDGGCLFLAYANTLDFVRKAGTPLTPFSGLIWNGRHIPLKCWGPPTAHEPAHRRNVDPNDPASAICLCSFHNGFIENEPDFGYATGLLVRGNGLPLRKGLTRDVGRVS